MAFLFHNGRGRTDIDTVVRQSDHTLNVLVIVLFAAFSLVFGAYRYGQLSQMPNASSATVQMPQNAPKS